MAERRRAIVVEFPHLTPKQEESVTDAVENALIEWSFGHPVAFGMTVVKPGRDSGARDGDGSEQS